MQIQDEQAQHLSATLESLSERIARLSIGLGVRLDDPQAVQHLMNQPPSRPIEAERRKALVDGKSDRFAPSADRRAAHLREELRGLLVLRYHLETVILSDNGLTLTRQIIAQAQEHLVHKGFQPGANGLDLDNFFNAK